ncbi:tyrosine-protein phosphatase [Chryseobacterium sp. LAM-KRS1]|uniref:tyrosine-protein phosphatase n=1 Tax=Chryseobacterium sp. LAM-KRS1 TaxID=2715754 RepID=UPI001553881D|nr:tyrosine-protein phosphatase [Chryseobacterium sp. LAM-KRS1]
MNNEQKIIRLSGSLNTRDLGGLQSSDGRMIKYGALYRSSQLNYLTEQDVEILKRLNIRTIVDFRALKEAEELPDKLPLNVKVVNVPILGNKIDKSKIAEYVKHNDLPITMEDEVATWKYGPFQRMLYLVNSYRNPDYIEVVKQYRAFFQLISMQPIEEALLYHCTGGRDRTGLATVFLLNMLDIPMDKIKENYLQSNLFLQPDRGNPNSEEFKKFIFSNVYIQPIDNIHFKKVAEEFGTTTQKIYDALKLKPEYINQILGNIIKKYGSLSNFYKTEFGIGEYETKMLREKYLE